MSIGWVITIATGAAVFASAATFYGLMIYLAGGR